jgi:hypothetical protein
MVPSLVRSALAPFVPESSPERNIWQGRTLTKVRHAPGVVNQELFRSLAGVWPIFLAMGLCFVETDPLREHHRDLVSGVRIMDAVPKVSRERYIEAMRSKFESILGGVADAVDEAPEGQIINASEEKVRDLFAEFRRVAYEAALQARIDAAEAASPPSEGG